MTKAQKLARRLSEIRQRLAELRNAETDAEIQERDSLHSEMETTEAEWRTESEAEERAAAVLPGQAPPDRQQRELLELRGRVNIGAYVEAALEGRAVNAGPELEFNQALEIPANHMPLELLAPEERATTNVDAAANQGTWLDRLFADAAAMRLGVSFRSVSPGVAAYPVTTAGASAAQRGRGQAAGDAAWTVGVTEIKPTRNAVRAVFAQEDSYRLPGLEQALRRDLSAALVEGVDRAIFVGDSGANENTADITGLQTAAGVTEKTLTQSNKVLGNKTLETFSEFVDGIYAAGLDDLRIVAAVGAYRLWLSTVLSFGTSNTIDAKMMSQFLMESGLSYSVRGGIETATGNGKFGAFIGLGRGIEGAAISAVWNSAHLVRDEVTGAAKGEVALTLSHLWGFQIPRPANFGRLKFVT